MNVIVRPDVCGRYYKVLRNCFLLIVEGTVQKQGGILNVLAEGALGVERLTTSPPMVSPQYSGFNTHVLRIISSGRRMGRLARPGRVTRPRAVRPQSRRNSAVPFTVTRAHHACKLSFLNPWHKIRTGLQFVSE